MTFKVIILSAKASNLVPCVQAVLKHEPELPPDHVLIVDDGARAEAERQLPGVQWLTGIKPFIFARNANLALQSAGTDVILLNDDALLVTPRGFSQMEQMIQTRPNAGVYSPGIRGVVGNPHQLAVGQQSVRIEPSMLAFVCVYIPQRVYQRLGFLDERFSGYGFEDNDYCNRVRAAGLELGVWDGCVVDHDGALPSTYRTSPQIGHLFQQNQQLFQAKWKGNSVTENPNYEGRCVDLQYIGCNRLEFTCETFTTLVANTDWQYIQTLYVYDDGSTDGTREWLEQQLSAVPTPTRFIQTKFGSPVDVMRHFIETSTAPIMAKLDNDAMVPPGWLRQSLEVLKRHPELDLLGIEAMYPVDHDPGVTRTYTPADFVSGLGLYRRRAFANGRPKSLNKYYGLEEWQMAQGPSLKRGWITPALPVFLLDHFPFAPWTTYSESYIARGWQRRSPPYNPADTLWKWRWRSPETSAAPKSFNAPLRLNLGAWGMPLPGFTNIEFAPLPGAEGVDLRQRWEWEDNSVDYIRAWDVIEHLPDKIFTMNELWRVLKPFGSVEIEVPTTDGSGAFQDPTHVSFWNRRSFLYFEAGNPYRDRFAPGNGVRARFKVLREQTEQTVDGPRLIIVLQAQKP